VPAAIAAEINEHHGSTVICERRTSTRHRVEGPHCAHPDLEGFVRSRRRVGRLNVEGDGQGDSAWLLWAGIHIYFLIGFANRLLVTLQWGISFVSKRRGVRILPLAGEVAQADTNPQKVTSQASDRNRCSP
jgi:hypothetical protein